MGSLFLLLWWITLKPKKELNNFQFLLRKMTRQGLKLGRFMTKQVANTLSHVQWRIVIFTPEYLPLFSVGNSRNIGLYQPCATSLFEDFWWKPTLVTNFKHWMCHSSDFNVSLSPSPSISLEVLSLTFLTLPEQVNYCTMLRYDHSST